MEAQTHTHTHIYIYIYIYIYINNLILAGLVSLFDKLIALIIYYF